MASFPALLGSAHRPCPVPPGLPRPRERASEGAALVNPPPRALLGRHHVCLWERRRVLAVEKASTCQRSGGFPRVLAPHPLRTLDQHADVELACCVPGHFITVNSVCEVFLKSVRGRLCPYAQFAASITQNCSAGGVKGSSNCNVCSVRSPCPCVSPATCPQPHGLNSVSSPPSHVLTSIPCPHLRPVSSPLCPHHHSMLILMSSSLCPHLCPVSSPCPHPCVLCPLL